MICYRGHVDCMTALLNIERVYLKKTLFDQLLREKNRYRFKNMDIKNGHLAISIFHDPDTVKRHEDFNIRVFNLFATYARDIVDRYRQILTAQDILKRNPIHYGAMSKYTKCFRTLEAILDIDIDQVPGTDDFTKLFFQIQQLETKEESRFDPRKYKNVLSEFQHLLSVADYNRVCKEFKNNVKLLLKEVMNCQDVNYHTPLHISSYYGDFKASRLLTLKGSNPDSAATAEAPLEVAKDKFSRGVLQTLNKAANTANTQDLEYLVNCGENIDDRASILGQGAIHKAVLCQKDEDTKANQLEQIFKCNADINMIDANGWTALHHAAYTGDLPSVELLTGAGANVNAVSNQYKTPLHFAALNNHEEVLAALLGVGADMESKDEQGCTPLHLACKKKSQESL